jgi:hypothetical protein
MSRRALFIAAVACTAACSSADLVVAEPNDAETTSDADATIPGDGGGSDVGDVGDVAADAKTDSDARPGDGGCAAGEKRCGDRCVDTTGDPANCGECGKACATPTNGTPSCKASTCGVTCATGYVALPSMTCVKSCPASVGCGSALPSGETCVAGSGCSSLAVIKVKWAEFPTVFGCKRDGWPDSTVECSDSAREWCATHGFTGGFGPVESTDDAATVVCTGAPVVFSGLTKITDFSAVDPGCNASTANRWECLIASHAWCVKKGANAGYGFVGADPTRGNATALCFPSPLTVPAALNAADIDPGLGCVITDPAQRRAARCLAAVHRRCVALGHLTGIGPYEAAPGGAWNIVCLRAP